MQLCNLQKALNKAKKHFGITDSSKHYGIKSLQLADIEKTQSAKAIWEIDIYRAK
jgi:hypothetical protein